MITLGDNLNNISKKKFGLIILVGVVILVGLNTAIEFPIGKGTSFETRSLSGFNNMEIEIYFIYYESFEVLTTETQTNIAPDLYFEINVNTHNDTVPVEIKIAIFDVDEETFQSIDWDQLNFYHLVNSGTYANNVNYHLDLHNQNGNYTWTAWFETPSQKTCVWHATLDLTLRYNWM